MRDWLEPYKDEVMRLAKEGQSIGKPSDIIKNPITLEFLGLKPDAVYSESKLENAIINKMQQFLLEMLCKGLHKSSYANKFIMQSDLN